MTSRFFPPFLMTADLHKFAQCKVLNDIYNLLRFGFEHVQRLVINITVNGIGVTFLINQITCFWNYKMGVSGLVL